MRGVRAYRRRLRSSLLIVVAPMWAITLVLVETRPIDWWSFMAGAIGTSAAALFVFLRDEPPRHIVNWRLGAEGERKTEKALLSLERRGWTVEHDIEQKQGANLDHVVTGPPGVFLLETKNLAGTITFEDGALVAHQFDDPDEVYRYRTLASRLRGQAKELSARLRQETGRRAWITAVVVIWGHFPEGRIEHENVVYIPGDQLATWLTSRPAPTRSPREGLSAQRA